MRNTGIYVCCFFCLLFSGCVAPGSRMAYIGIRMKFADEVLFSEDVKVVLMPEYKIEESGDSFVKSKDGEGRVDFFLQSHENEIEIEMAPVFYHVNYWIIPPLGGYPRYPPFPLCWIQFSDDEENIYLVGINENDDFEYKTFDVISHQEKQLLQGKWILEKGRYLSEKSKGEKYIWYLEFELKKSPTL